MRKLSICIPVYNNQNVFRHCLRAACEAVTAHDQDAEIVISDNHSSEDISSVYEHFSTLYPSICMKYHRNESNVGFTRNCFQVVSMAFGQFCWIIGCDDFVYIDGVQRIINIIDNNPDIDFICCNHDLVDVNGWQPEYTSRSFGVTGKTSIQKHKGIEGSKPVEKLEALICPEVNNVYLGAMMTCIFRKVNWVNVEKSKMKLDGDPCLDSIYPHCYIFSRGFLNKKAYYCDTPLIIAGEGAREWNTDNGTPFWDSLLPIIYFIILGDVLIDYYAHGLSRANYMACMKENAWRIGGLYFSLLKIKIVDSKSIRNGELINPLKILLRYCLFSSFYYGMLTVLIRKLRSN